MKLEFRLRQLATRLRRSTRAELQRYRDDTRFVARAYINTLGRPVDDPGLIHWRNALRDGLSRDELIETLRRSEEALAFERRTPLPSLRAERPDLYTEVSADNGIPIPVVVADTDAVLEWLYDGIHRNGYYSRPHDWSFAVDEDKRALASLLVIGRPRSVLELGCSSGGVLHQLLQDGIDDVCGVDISEYALQHATPEIRPHLVHADIAETDLGRRFDTVAAFDVLEHVTPERLAVLLDVVSRHLAPGGRFVTNIPAFGRDRVFGEPFPIYVQSWRRDALARRPFRHLPVDVDGYPLLGHLIWATTRWWTNRLAASGLHRDRPYERVLQAAAKQHLAENPSRRTLFVCRTRPPRRGRPELPLARKTRRRPRPPPAPAPGRDLARAEHLGAAMLGQHDRANGR